MLINVMLINKKHVMMLFKKNIQLQITCRSGLEEDSVKIGTLTGKSETSRDVIRKLWTSLALGQYTILTSLLIFRGPLTVKK